MLCDIEHTQFIFELTVNQGNENTHIIKIKKQ